MCRAATSSTQPNLDFNFPFLTFKFPQPSMVHDVAAQCNAHKLAARKAQDASAALFFRLMVHRYAAFHVFASSCPTVQFSWSQFHI